MPRGAGGDRAAARTAAQDRFAGLCEDFVGYLETVRRLSPNSCRAYRTDLLAYVDWARREGVVPLDATHRDLRSYLSELQRAGYSTRTLNRHLSAIRDVYRWLVAEGVTTNDPAAALASPKQAKTLPKTMSDADVQRLIETCDTTTPVGLRDRCSLELMYATGARIAELSGLDVSSVDLAAAQVRLFGKGSKERIVPIYGAAVEWVATYLQQARPVLLAKSRSVEKTRALLVSTRGNRMSADALRTCFERRVAEAGLEPGITPHAMRHTFATELLGGGADLRTVQELLGHADLGTTQIYTHLSVDRLKDAARQAHPRSDG